MFTLSLYHKPGKDSQARHVFDLSSYQSPLIALQNHCKPALGSPRYWTFARWNDGVQRVKHNGTTAILLEYPKSVTNELTQAIKQLGFQTYVLTFDNTIAAIFPLEQEATFTQHCRLVSVLCELLGINGVSSDTIKPTYLIKPTDDAQIVEYPGEIIPSGFIRDTHDMDTDFNRWTGAAISQPTPVITERTIKVNLDTADAEAKLKRLADLSKEVKAEPKSQSDEAFDRMDDAVVRLAASVEEFGKAAADLRKQMGGQ